MNEFLEIENSINQSKPGENTQIAIEKQVQAPDSKSTPTSAGSQSTHYLKGANQKGSVVGKYIERAIQRYHDKDKYLKQQSESYFQGCNSNENRKGKGKAPNKTQDPTTLAISRIINRKEQSFECSINNFKTEIYSLDATFGEKGLSNVMKGTKQIEIKSKNNLNQGKKQIQNYQTVGLKQNTSKMNSMNKTQRNKNILQSVLSQQKVYAAYNSLCQNNPAKKLDLSKVKKEPQVESSQRKSEQFSSLNRKSSITPSSTTDRSLIDMQLMGLNNMKIQLQNLRSKMSSSYKEISSMTIKDFKNHSYPPSKDCFKAARSLCLFLNAFHQYQEYRLKSFRSWETILQFLMERNTQIMQDLKNVRGKCEQIKPQIEPKMLEILQNEIFPDLVESKNKCSNLKSPKTKHQAYKPIISYVYFTIQYVKLRNKYESMKQEQQSASYYLNSSIQMSQSSKSNSPFLRMDKARAKVERVKVEQNSKVQSVSPIGQSRNKLITMQAKYASNKGIKPYLKNQKKPKQAVSQNKLNTNRSIYCESINIEDMEGQYQKQQDQHYQISQHDQIEEALISIDQDHMNQFKSLNVQGRDKFNSIEQNLIGNQEYGYWNCSQEIDLICQSDIKCQEQYNQESEPTIESNQKVTINKELEETLRLNIEEACSRSQKVKLEDLLTKVKQHDYQELRKKIAFLEQKCKNYIKEKESTIVSQEENVQNLEEKNKEICEMEKDLEMEFKMFRESSRLSLRDEGKLTERSASDLPKKVPVQSKEKIIQELKEKRRNSQERKRGEDLDAQTLNIIQQRASQLNRKEPQRITHFRVL